MTYLCVLSIKREPDRYKDHALPEHRRLMAAALLLPVAVLAGCGPSYSPDTYASRAVQQANKVDQGVIVGVREVALSADTTVGTVSGAAAGGIIGAQTPGGSIGSAFGALGGTVVGGLVGTVVQSSVGDKHGYEYIVRKSNGDMLSVTQVDTTALALGQKVLLISGNQARIVADYTVPTPTPVIAVMPPAVDTPPEVAPTPAVVTATPLAPPVIATPVATVANPGAGPVVNLPSVPITP